MRAKSLVLRKNARGVVPVDSLLAAVTQAGSGSSVTRLEEDSLAMLQSATSPSSASSASSSAKRRIDSLFETLPMKRPPSSLSQLQSYRAEFNDLLHRKEAWLLRQKRSSLLVEPCKVDEESVMNEFAPLYRAVSSIAVEAVEHSAQLALIEDIIRESIVLEWPRQVFGIQGVAADEAVEVDQAPLIHRARNVVKCRTSHPTMRIKVYAISSSCHDRSSFSLSSSLSSSPSILEAFFRATLTKSFSGNEPRNAQVAGRMILTQREGTAAAKSADRSGAVVTEEGRLVASHATPDNHTYTLLARYGETNVRTTSFKYENGDLCATFPEMGVTLNSMVDRRQLATRYAIQIEVGINIDNKLIVQHTTQSLPFLIAITNDQTEPLLYSIVWSRLLERENFDGSEPQRPLPWNVLREAIGNFIKSQLSHARRLSPRELLHIQAMLFLPRVARCRSLAELEAISSQLFGGKQRESEERLDGSQTQKAAALRENLRRRLLEEDVDGNVAVEKAEFMTERCVSLLDGRTELKHSLWQWLFKATEMILDVGHKLCPSPAIVDKKTSKGKKQLSTSEECHSMLTLFNKGVMTFCSVRDVCCAYSELPSEEVSGRGEAAEENEESGAIFCRFDDENTSHLSVAFGLDTSNEEEQPRPIMGTISAETIKEFKQGLPEFVMDEAFPARHGRLIRITEASSSSAHSSHQLTFSTIRKRVLFNTYQSLRSANEEASMARDSVTVRVNVLTGERVERKQPPLSSGLPFFFDEDPAVAGPSNGMTDGIHSESLATSPFSSLVPGTPLSNGNGMDSLPAEFAQVFSILLHSATLCGVAPEEFAKLLAASSNASADGNETESNQASAADESSLPINSPPQTLEDILRKTEPDESHS